MSRRDFLPFGEEIDADATHRTAARKYGQADNVRQKFTGYQNDEETGLDFAEARMYENRHGRFTAVDPLLASGRSADPQTFNRYVYVMNNPLNLIDPSGMQAASTPDNSGPDNLSPQQRQMWERIRPRWYDAPYERTVLEGPGILDSVTKTVTSAIVTFAENNGSELLVGPTDVEHNTAGRAIGHTASIVQGVNEVIAGGTLAVGGGGGTVVTAPACGTGVGCALPSATAAIAVAGAAAAVHGVTVIGNTVNNMVSGDGTGGGGGNRAKDYNPAGRSKIQTAEDAADQAKDLREAKKNADQGKGDKIIDSTKKSDDREIQMHKEEYLRNKKP